jgi:hypothetical protein
MKGLCADCAVELSGGLACKSRCEEDAKNVISVLHASIRTAPTSESLLRGMKGKSILATAFLLGFGAMFVAWGLCDEAYFPITMGACFATFGVGMLFYSLRIRSPKR